MIAKLFYVCYTFSMTIKQCTKLYNELSKKNNCSYKLVWMKRVKKFNSAGWCSWKNKTIRLQPVFIELNNEEDIIDLILHEIAHALMPKHHHNKFWKRKAIEIGCSGNRCYGKHIKKQL